jgi:hypothetical protein
MAARHDFRSALRLAVAATAVVVMINLVAGAGSASATLQGGTTAQSDESGGRMTLQQAQARRPFNHERHERVVSCRQCHGSGTGHGAILIRTPLDCASCHHAANIGRTCADCHVTDSIPAPAIVTAPMSMSVWDSARSRDLPFRHSLHVAAVACNECHRTTTTLTRDRECASCHDSHHTPQADCSACHTLPRAGAHSLPVHLSCAGSSCHAVERAPPPAFSRTLCLVCHPAQATHEPGGNCAECHLIREHIALSSRSTGRLSLSGYRE